MSVEELEDTLDSLESELSGARDEIRQLGDEVRDHLHCPQCDAVMLSNDKGVIADDGTELCCEECAYNYWYGG